MEQSILRPSIPAQENIDFERRFGGLARLYGAAALARSAIGSITMIDLDNVAESNVNRQIHALTDTLGKAKVSALAERIAQINPLCRVTEVEDFITADNLEQTIGSRRFDYIIDAIDDVRAKTALIAYCREKGMRLVTVGSAGGQSDPTRIEIRDLSRTEQEPLLAKVRNRLRAHH